MDISKFKWHLESAKSIRQKLDLRWYILQTFIESNTYWSIDMNSKKLIETKPAGVKRKINLTRAILRWIRNSITRNDPRWHPELSRIDMESSEEERSIANIVLQNTWRDQDCKLKLKDLIRHSSIKSVWYWQVYFDPNLWDYGDVSIKTIDAWDVFTDPYWQLDGWRYDWDFMIKAVQTSLEKIKADTTYSNTSELNPESRIAESDRKSEYLKQRNWTEPNSKLTGTVILYEIYFRDENRKYIKMQTFCQWQTLTDEIDTWFTRFPIVPYQMERMWWQLYPTPWSDPVVEMNKSVNRIASSIENYVYTVAKGRYMVRKSERLSSVMDEHWQFIKYDNVPPTPMAVSPMWDVPFVMMWNFERWAWDVWWNHWTSSGRQQMVKTRSSSWVENFIAMDLELMSEPIDNLKVFLSNVAELILDAASKNYDKKRKLYIKDKETNIVWSEVMSDKLKWEYSSKVVKVKPFKWIYVDIIPGSIFTDLQKRQDMLAMREMGVKIPDSVMLETFAVGNAEEIVAKIKLEQEENKNPDVEIANWENKKMMLNQEVHANDTDDHQIHLAIHWKLLEQARQNAEISKLLVQHMRWHEAFMKWGTPNPINMENIPGAMWNNFQNPNVQEDLS